MVVRGVQQGFCWEPQVMARATTEKNTKHGIDTEIEVRHLVVGAVMQGRLLALKPVRQVACSLHSS